MHVGTYRFLLCTCMLVIFFMVDLITILEIFVIAYVTEIEHSVRTSNGNMLMW